MKTAGIIAEYNPFHNGHKYHLEKAREITGADYIIAVISGNFTQRGTPAIIDKYARTKMALQCGADLVLELPVYYAAGSAEYFAAGAIALLDKLGITDSLCFGSECGDISLLSDIAETITKEPYVYQSALQTYIKSGNSFPLARSLALTDFYSNKTNNRLSEIIASPNNILGIEYMKALIKRNSFITPYTITRRGAGYHDSLLSKECTSSASAIRSAVSSENELEMIKAHIPDEAYPILSVNFHKTFPIYYDDFSSLLHYKLLSEEDTGYTKYIDVNHDLADKIRKNLNNFTAAESFCGLLKSKDITYSRLSRCLLHILLNMGKEEFSAFISDDYIYYARILGFRKGCGELLHSIKRNAEVPLISKLADAYSLLNENGIQMLKKDIYASHIYDSVIFSKFHTPFINEHSKQIILG